MILRRPVVPEFVGIALALPVMSILASNFADPSGGEEFTNRANDTEEACCPLVRRHCLGAPGDEYSCFKLR
eukprot:12384500-Heterocapsa_arctica.AAC.1